MLARTPFEENFDVKAHSLCTIWGRGMAVVVTAVVIVDLF